MTIEEAIKILKDGRENLYEILDKSVPYEQQHTLVALDIAIKSLKAWDKVKEIFKAKSTSEDWEYIHDLQIWEDALDIIDKHLKEASE